MEKPTTLTIDRCEAVLPALGVSPEWQRKHDAGELPEGLAGFRGMLQEVWPEAHLTLEEAEYILWLHGQGSIRWLANELMGDDNQIIGTFLIEAAQRASEREDQR